MTGYLITSALPYINGVKHLGNLAGSLLPVDVHVRFRRQTGAEVLFVAPPTGPERWQSSRPQKNGRGREATTSRAAKHRSRSAFCCSPACTGRYGDVCQTAGTLKHGSACRSRLPVDQNFKSIWLGLAVEQCRFGKGEIAELW